MQKAYNRMIMILLCLTISLLEIQTEKAAILFTIALSIAALGIYFANKHYQAFVIVVFLFASLKLPNLMFFYPLIALELSEMTLSKMIMPEKVTKNENRKKWIWFFATSMSFIVIHMLVNSITFFHKYITIEILFIIIAIGITIYENQITELKQQMIRTRDTSVEYNEQLKNKNRHLIEKQDYEIHLATLKERNRIAREIHDNVGHELSRSILQVGALLTISKEKEMNEYLHGIKKTLDSAMNNVRQSVHNLHDDAIDLPTVIKETLKSLSEFTCQLEYDMGEEIPRNIKYCIITITKEAVNNMIKHSNGKRANFVFREHPAFYQIQIEDNGKINREKSEYNVKQLKENKYNILGIGLENMEERVKSLHGTFRISLETGFHIFITIPKDL